MSKSSILSKFSITNKMRQSLTPERQRVNSLSEIYNIKTQDISFCSQDGIHLNGWWIKGKNDITIVLSHSFGANRSGWKGADAKGNNHEIDWLPSIKTLVDANYNVIAFDHRACGESEGDLTYFGKKEALDIVAAVHWVTGQHKNLNKFCIVGFSSGANATLRAIRILENENTQIHLTGIAINLYWYERMIKNSTKFFTNIPTFIVPIIKNATQKVVGFNPEIEINPSNTLSQIQSPILIVNAEFDEIGSEKDIIDIYKKGICNTSLKILHNETRFDAYHFIEKHPKDIISFISNNLEKKTAEKSINNIAILLIEFQKTWTEKGIFKKIIKKEYESRHVLTNTEILCSEARNKGIKIIQAPLILDKKDENYKKTPFPARLLKRFTKGTWKAEFTESIYAHTDIVVEGRYDFDATKGSNLEKVLQEHNIKTIFVAGFTTDHCVKDTMNSLIKKGFKCVMVSDCTATKNNKLQKKIEDEFTIIQSKELIEKLKGLNEKIASR